MKLINLILEKMRVNLIYTDYLKIITFGFLIFSNLSVVTTFPNFKNLFL